jgi:elongation factor P
VLRFFFCEEKDPSKRFSFTEEQIGSGSKFLKPNEVMDGIVFNDKIINVVVPIKVQLKVTDAPPGIKGDTAQGGTKTVVLETGAEINAPLFIEAGDVIEINTESGEYVRRV